MTKETLHSLGLSLLISVAIYPIVLIGVWALVALGSLATDLQMPSDLTPLIYGLVFAVLTVALIDFLGVASVILALIACANLIEYMQLMIPGRSASLVDFLASLGGVLIAAVLVWVARSLVQRSRLWQRNPSDTNAAEFN